MLPNADDKAEYKSTNYWYIPELSAEIRPGAFTQGLITVPPETVPPAEAKLWRFMDFPKLLSLLETRALFFTRADRLEDQFEGTWSDATLQLLDGTTECDVIEHDEYVILRNRNTGHSLKLQRPITVPMSPAQRQVFNRLVSSQGSDSTRLSFSGNKLLMHHVPTGQRFIVLDYETQVAKGEQATAYALGDRIEALDVSQQMVGGARTRSRFTMVNCWYESEHESDAMWRLYSGNEYGLAVRTDMRALIGSFVGRYPNTIARVKYIPYRDEVMPMGIHTPFLFKRINFEHEREVRIIMTQYVEFQELDGDRNSVKYDFSTDVCEVGLYYDVEPQRLVQEIVVSPYAAPWLLDLTQSVARKYEVEVPVRVSNLSERPVR